MQTMISHGTTENSNASILPQWVNLPLKRLRGQVTYSPTVLIDHYLIAIVHQSRLDRAESDEEEKYFDHRALIFAVDLRDNSVQQTQVSSSIFHEELVDYTLTKYKDNQIIKFGGEIYGGPSGNVARITIESFERIFISSFHI